MNEITKNRKSKLIIGVLVALVLIAGIIAYFVAQTPSPEPVEPAATSQTQPEQPQDVITYTAKEGQTALEQLKTVADVETTDSEYGAFVDSINGLKGDTDNKYWIFYIDGESSTVGAGDYVAKGGELIKWKLEEAK